MQKLRSRLRRAIAALTDWSFAPAALFFLIWAIGFIGFEANRSDGTLFDSAYRSLQLFGLNFETEQRGETSATLNVARFLAAGFVVIAVVALFTRAFIEWLRIFLQSRSKNRHVLLGFGTVNHAIANELRSRKVPVPVTAVDRTFNEADKRFARASGILLVAGDLSDPTTLDRCRLTRTGAIFAACGDDSTTIEVAAAVAQKLAKVDRPDERPSTFEKVVSGKRQDAPKVYAHLSSVRTVATLKEARDAAYVRNAGFQPFSLKNDVATDLIDCARLTARARERGQRRVHLVIVGVGDQGEALFTHALLGSYAHDLGPPRITFIERKARAARQRLVALYPRLFDESIPEQARPHLETWITADALTLSFDGDDRLDRIYGDGNAPTAWIFACGDDNTNMDAGLRLELAMQSLRQVPAPIYIHLRGTVIEQDVLAELHPLRFTRIFGSLSSTARHAAVLRRDADDLPKLLHQFYRDAVATARTLSQAAGSETQQIEYQRAHRAYEIEWDALPDNVRDSNRRAARHAMVKLMDLGLQWRGMEKGALPWIAKSVIVPFERAAAAMSFSDSEARPLYNSPEKRLWDAASVEHLRWMADRALSGWQAGPQSPSETGSPRYRRDDRRRWHDNIKPFSEVDAKTRSYDVALVRALLHYLSGPTGVGKEQAFIKKTLEIAVDDSGGAVPTNHSTDHVTELVIGIAAAVNAISVEREQAIINLVNVWARKECAVRIQIRTERPLSVPPLKGFEGLEASLARFVERLRTVAGREIIVDVTPLYRSDVAVLADRVF